MNTFTRMMVCFSLTSCAGTDWERAAYEGTQQAGEKCAIRSRPSDPPCAKLPDYGIYTRERGLLMAPKAVVSVNVKP
jgi:hypothetical protein